MGIGVSKDGKQEPAKAEDVRRARTLYTRSKPVVFGATYSSFVGRLGRARGEHSEDEQRRARIYLHPGSNCRYRA